MREYYEDELVTHMKKITKTESIQEYLHLYEPYQKAVINWDGTTETLILASAVKSDNLTDIAWVVPILSSSMPNVTAGNMSVFEDLVEYFKGGDPPRIGNCL